MLILKLDSSAKKPSKLEIDNTVDLNLEGPWLESWLGHILS